MSTRLAALDTISACLRVGMAPGEHRALEATVSASSVDWQRVVALADQNLVSPTLWAQLAYHQLESRVPEAVQQYLREIHRLNAERNRRIREQMLEIGYHLNGIGVEPVLLKGLTYLFDDTYPQPCPRILTDIDILVPLSQTEACWELLRERGFSAIGDDYDFSKHNHLRPLHRPGDYATIEIHREILQPSFTGRLFGITLTGDDAAQATALFEREARRESIDGVRFRMPSPTCRVMHCALHSAFSEFNAYRCGILPLRPLYELALLQHVFANQIDWEKIVRTLHGGGKARVLRVWVYLAHRLFGSELPAHWRTNPAMIAHYLRCRLQARWGLSITLMRFQRL